MPFRLPKFGRTTTILLGLLVVFAVVVALFDWNWFRHPVEQYLIDRSHREVRIGDLHVDLGFSLEPTVRVRDVYIENAPWADKRPFIVAGEASFTFSLKSVWEGRPVISRLVLIDAELDMERQADGLRNWRLRKPEDRGPGKVKVMSLEPHRTKIRFARRDVDLDITTTASEAQSGSDGLKPDTSHPTRLDFKGEFRGTALSGAVLTGERLTFLDTRESFPMRGHVSAGNGRLDIDGTMADMFNLSAIDAKMHLAGSSLSKLPSFLRVSLPASRPYEIDALVRMTKDNVSLTQVRAKIGNTDLVGEFSLDRSTKRKFVRAALRSESADLSDFGSLGGSAGSSDKAAADIAEPAANDSGSDSSKSGAPKRLFSDRAINGERLKALDAHVTLDARKLKAVQVSALESLRVTADLKDGILALKPIDIGLAGGHVAGTFTLDGQHAPLSAQAKIELNGVRLERLLGKGQKKTKSAGPIDGQIGLKGQGDSVAKILASTSGSVEIAMEDGDISNLLDAELGLNIGKILRVLMTGDRAININSAVVVFDFAKGLGRSKTILLDTDQTHTDGTGTIDLGAETVEILLTPRPKKPGSLALNSSIRVHGPIRKPKFSLTANASEESADRNKESEAQPKGRR